MQTYENCLVGEKRILPLSMKQGSFYEKVCFFTAAGNFQDTKFKICRTMKKVFSLCGSTAQGAQRPDMQEQTEAVFL
jgi:hypothetical protein